MGGGGGIEDDPGILQTHGQGGSLFLNPSLNHRETFYTPQD